MILGSVVGGYRILDLVGEGGMGTVFRAVDVLLEREVALKLLRPELTHEPDLVKRFRTEAVALARLNHPHIVTLHHLFRDGDQYFMVLEFVQGETIDKLIDRCSPLPWQTAVPLICQSLNGLEHAHILKVIHRDIKPSNLILTQQSTVKIMDFGIARMLETDGVTQAGNILGTVKYMPPEQILGQEIDFRADIYGIGAVLYEMVTGQPPFGKRTDYELIRAKVEESPEAPRKRAPHIPRRLDAIILKALAKEPQDRFQSAGAFRTELEAVLAEPFCDEDDDEAVQIQPPDRPPENLTHPTPANLAVAEADPIAPRAPETIVASAAALASSAADGDATVTSPSQLAVAKDGPELEPDNWWEDDLPEIGDTDATRTGPQPPVASADIAAPPLGPQKPAPVVAEWVSNAGPEEPLPFWKQHPGKTGLALAATITALSVLIGIASDSTSDPEPEVIAQFAEPPPGAAADQTSAAEPPSPHTATGTDEKAALAPPEATEAQTEPVGVKPADTPLAAVAEPEKPAYFTPDNTDATVTTGGTNEPTATAALAPPPLPESAKAAAEGPIVADAAGEISSLPPAAVEPGENEPSAIQLLDAKTEAAPASKSREQLAKREDEPRAPQSAHRSSRAAKAHVARHRHAAKRHQHDNRDQSGGWDIIAE